LMATAVNNGVELVWTDNSDGETGYKIERSANGVDFQQIDSVGADATEYTDTTADAGVMYTYRVRASNDGGDSAYSDAADVTTISGVPQNLTATTTPPLDVAIGWDDVAGE